MLRSPLIIFPLLLVLSLFLTAPAKPLPLTFTHGVASGDVTSFSAVLWTRVDRETVLKAEVSTDPAFAKLIFNRVVRASATNDFTAKVIARGLQPNTHYFYRWRHGSSLSDVGTFETAPPPGISTQLRFAFSGDSDGTRVGSSPFFNNFEALDAARLEGLDFFVYLGDTVYSDSSLRASPAETLDEYRDIYKVNREVPALRNLLKATSTYAIWDDHEVRGDFDGQTVDPTLLANGREAFKEYMPILEASEELDVEELLEESGLDDLPEELGFFRIFRWGKDVDIIILDERSFRSADVEAACSFAPGVPDLAPTLPSFLRPALELPASPPPGCLEAIFDPSRTMLGDLQKKLFKAALLHSKARFKFVINEVPIQQFYGLPYDRWEGYGAERNEILNFMRDNEIKNVIFLTTDTHANLINQVFIDNFTDPTPIAEEFVTGPIATVTLQQAVLRGFGPAALAGFHAILNTVGVDCRHLDTYSYGLVEVDASAGMTSITLKDSAGNVVHDQLNPAIPCAKTINP